MSQVIPSVRNLDWEFWIRNGWQAPSQLIEDTGISHLEVYLSLVSVNLHVESLVLFGRAFKKSIHIDSDSNIVDASSVVPEKKSPVLVLGVSIGKLC